MEEKRYSGICSCIGASMLIFLLCTNITSILMTVIQMFGGDSWGMTFTIIYELCYGLLYLLTFFIPAWFFRGRMRKKELPLRMPDHSAGISPWLPLLFLSTTVLSSCWAIINDVFSDVLQYSAFSEEVLWGSMSKQKPYEIILNCIITGLVPGVCEEFLFRGTIQENLRPYGKTTAIVGSAFLFGMMHQNVEQILYAFCAGILLGIIYEKTGNLWNTILIHILNNLYSVLVSVLSAGEEDAQILCGKIDTCVVGLGILSTIILVFAYFRPKKTWKNGFFGKILPASDDYAEVRLSPDVLKRKFFSTGTSIFLVYSVLEIIWLIIQAILYNKGIITYG